LITLDVAVLVFAVYGAGHVETTDKVTPTTIFALSS